MTVNYAYQSMLAMTVSSTDLRFYLSPDNNVTGATGSGDILLGSKAVSGTLPGPSSIQGGTVTLKVPATTARGFYYVCAIIDQANRVAESDETNNSKCSDLPIEVRRIVDLVMSQISTAAPTVDSGYSFSLDSNELNQGLTGMTVTSNTIKFYLSPDATVTGVTGSGDILLTGTRSVRTLAAGASAGVASTTVKVPGTTLAGNYYVCAIADATNAEKLEVMNDGVTSAEGNNGRCSDTTIRVRRAVDLVMTETSTASTSVAKGSTFSINNTEMNQGTTGMTVTSNTIRFYLSPNNTLGPNEVQCVAAPCPAPTQDILLTGTRTVSGALAAGASSASASTTVTVPNITAVAPGNYYVCSMADATNVEKLEVSETNNGLCTATTIAVTL